LWEKEGERGNFDSAKANSISKKCFESKISREVASTWWKGR